MGKVRFYDDEVADCFDQSIAIYFEAIRFRAQLYDKEEFFPMSSKDIQETTGLSYRKQRRAHLWLEGTDEYPFDMGGCKWIETKRLSTKGKNVLHFRITPFARGLVGKTVRRYNLANLRRNLVNSFNVKNNKKGLIHRQSNVT